MKDLVILVADKNTQFTIEGLLTRSRAFHIRPLSRDNYDIYVHPLHDPGIYKDAVDFLRPYQHHYRFSLVLFDREGSGQEQRTANQISQELKEALERSGWRERVEVIVFDPELEIWGWGSSPHIATHTGWENLPALLEFVRNTEYWRDASPKPQRPKEALEEALKARRIQRSSAIYKKIAMDASFKDCVDPSFEKLQRTLKNWFGQNQR
jgi:hypothetical protein